MKATAHVIFGLLVLIIFGLIALILSAPFFTGCDSKPTVTPTGFVVPAISGNKDAELQLEREVQQIPNPFSAVELVKTHPKLQRICDLAGGCDKVVIICNRYDGNRDSELRNTTFFHISAGGVTGIAWRPNLASYPDIVELAIADWFETRKLDSEWNSKNPESVNPNSSPCDATCLITIKPKSKHVAYADDERVEPEKHYFREDASPPNFIWDPQSIPVECVPTDNGDCIMKCPEGYDLGGPLGPGDNSRLTTCWHRQHETVQPVTGSSQ